MMIISRNMYLGIYSTPCGIYILQDGGGMKSTHTPLGILDNSYLVRQIRVALGETLPPVRQICQRLFLKFLCLPRQDCLMSN